MKPRRKHPALDSLVQSPQGLQFLRAIAPYIGFELEYEPVEQTRDGATIFRLSAGERPAVLVITKEQPDGSLWRHEWGLRAIMADGIVMEAHLTGYRWDPWLHESHTGDSTVLQLPNKRRRKLTDERSAAAGAARDILTCTWYPAAHMSEPLLGVPAGVLNRWLEPEAPSADALPIAG
jgi:hypothetical protein